jgi:hypothetical protein
VQDLRSQLLKSVGDVSEAAGADDLAKLGLVEAFDREIDRLLTAGNADVKLLKSAREQWGRLRASQSIEAMVTSPPVSRIDRTEGMFGIDAVGELALIHFQCHGPGF